MIAKTDDPRIKLLLGLYYRGVFDLEQTRCWAAELGLDVSSQLQLLTSCVEAHFGSTTDLTAA